MTTVHKHRDPVQHMGRSVALQVGAASALLAVLVAVVAVVLFDREQWSEINASVLTAATTADDVEDPPPQIWLVTLSTSGRHASPGTPAALANAPVLASAPAGPLTVAVHGSHYPAYVAKRSTGRFVAIYDIAAHREDEGRLLAAAAMAIAGGVVAAALIGQFAGRRAARPLAEALELQRQFVADASHELRTPLAVISTRAQMVRRHIGGDVPAARRAELDQLVADTKAMAAVVSDLLLSAQLEHAPVAAEEVDLRDVAGDVVLSLAAYAQERGVRLVLRDPPERPGRPVVRGVPSSLRRAVLALVDNAISHSPQGGLVEVVPDVDHAAARLSVVDHGTGLEPDDLDHLRRRFARSGADGSGQRVGLGLALVEQIMRSHDGGLSLTETPGGGATFTLELPVLPPA
jgi:signal transduction histidine kinase